jgi:hypothetical protein
VGDRARLASAFAVIGAMFAVLLFPSFDDRLGWMVRERTDLSVLAGYAVALTVLSGIYGFISAPRVIARAGGTHLTLIFATIAVVGAAVLATDIPDRVVLVAIAPVLVLSFIATAAAARTASETRAGSLVGDCYRRAVFGVAIRIPLTCFAVRFPYRPMGLATLGRHAPSWPPLIASVALAAFLALDVRALGIARRVTHDQPLAYRDAPCDDPIGGTVIQLRSQVVRSAFGLCIALGVLAVHVTAHRWLGQ